MKFLWKKVSKKIHTPNVCEFLTRFLKIEFFKKVSCRLEKFPISWAVSERGYI